MYGTENSFFQRSKQGRLPQTISFLENYLCSRINSQIHTKMIHNKRKTWEVGFHYNFVLLFKIPLRKWDKRQQSWTSTDPQTHKLARRARTDIQAFFLHVSSLHKAELVWPFKASCQYTSNESSSDEKGRQALLQKRLAVNFLELKYTSA